MNTEPENQTDQTDRNNQTETIDTPYEYFIEKWRRAANDGKGQEGRSLLELFNPEAFSRLKETPEGKAEIEAADKRLEEWEEAEEKRRQEERAAEWERKKKRAVSRSQAQLDDEIGYSLLCEIDPSNPGFDRKSFEKFMEWHPDPWGANVILYGPPGTGKSRAMAHRAYLLAEDYWNTSFAWITGDRFADLVSSIGIAEERSGAKQELRRLAEVGVLFFDDLGTAHFTKARVSRFFELVNTRFSQGNPTLFTTNYDSEKLRSMILSAGDGEDEIEADRIINRMMGVQSGRPACVFHFQRRKAGAEGTKKIKSP